MDDIQIGEVIYTPETLGKDVVFIKPNTPDCFTAQKTYTSTEIDIK